MAEKDGRTGDLNNRVDTKVTELVLVKRALVSKGLALPENSRENGCLKKELSVVWTANGQRGRVIHDFAEPVCTGYISPMRAQALS